MKRDATTATSEPTLHHFERRGPVQGGAATPGALRFGRE